MPIKYNYYSVDSSVMIELNNSFPKDLFSPVWDEVTRLIKDNRWKIFENVAEEINNDEVKKFLKNNSSAIVPFDSEVNIFMNKLMAELYKKKLTLINDTDLRNNADPWVIMLALYLERRDINNLITKTSNKLCCVLTEERPKLNRINIPAVCAEYGIHCMDLRGLMRHHDWHYSLNVQNP